MRTRLPKLLLLATLVALPAASVLHAVDDPLLVSEPSLDESGEVGGPKPCGSGTRTICGKVTSQTCVSWQLTTVTTGGSLSPTGGGINYSYVYTCERWVTTERNLYKDP